MNGEGREDETAKDKDKLVFMCGYLPGALPERSPISSPVVVRSDGFGWKDACGGGCGFAMAISDCSLFPIRLWEAYYVGFNRRSWSMLHHSGKTWGKASLVSLWSYNFRELFFGLFLRELNSLSCFSITILSAKEIPEPFPVPTDSAIIKAAAGWAHCVAATDVGEVYTWGWKECIPSGKVFGDPSASRSSENDVPERPGPSALDQVSPRPQASKSGGGNSGVNSRGADESTKRRKVSGKQTSEPSSSGDELLSAVPCLVTLNPGVRIVTVAAGGRHTLALSDIGQVWGWGYGGEGQLGLGSRIRMVSSPHPIPCIESSQGRDKSGGYSRAGMTSEGQTFRVVGNYVKAIACGGRHSVVITVWYLDSLYGLSTCDDLPLKLLHPQMREYCSLLAGDSMGRTLYPSYLSLVYFLQCGQGTTDDELSPTCVSSMLGIRMAAVAAGLWHSVCVSDDGDVYAFGGNQFGQLGTGVDQAETLPRLLDAPSLENESARMVSCGARHSAIVTGDGKVFCWGWNKYGQLGLGDVIDRNIPSQLAIEGYTLRSVACGWWHTLLLAEHQLP
ncbi:unnamed protein product [Linum tenue]|uniref:Ultraviolet-B receptor UVR8 n=1 Tax=Linum tenue TaxID=586396 RepID=A0AAV0MAM0_9ROSI|nr:unnamed protein product [Linum tenue]